MGQANQRALVAYDSRLGSTAEVAEFIGGALSEGGASVDINTVSEVTALEVYDRVVIGGAIRYDRWLPEAVAFVRKNRQILLDTQVAFFFTCLTLAKPSPETERKAEAYAAKIRQIAPDLRPTSVGRFAGVLEFARTPWPARLLLRALSVTTGVAEGDYRDWQAIRDWAMKLEAPR
ncbi:MAG: flavodoxin domain-containing protein [Paracoccaceae bacterium]|nr:flavodoxin domain-containing protein [Paracoccaceae bacterium]